MANRNDAAAIYDLRLPAYNSAEQFKVIAPEKLLWDEQDDLKVVLAACDEDSKIIATMRGGIVLSMAAAEEQLECVNPVNESALPALILGRGATRKEYRALGLNSALRYYFLSAILESRVKSVMGTVYANSPRIQTMKNLGYTFHVPAAEWNSVVQPIDSMLVARLERSKMGDACKTLKEIMSPILNEYIWQGELPRFNV